MVKVELNKSNNNPFYGLKNCLALFNNGAVTDTTLNNCWREVKDNKEKKEMFFSLLFSIGDITSRQHNIFKGIKRDNGGNANREAFYTILLWMKREIPEQFEKFLNAGVFNEYTCFDMLFRSRVKTSGTRVVAIYDIFADKKYCEMLCNYVYAIIKGNNDFNKLLVAKFLTIPRLSIRKGHKQMLSATKTVMLNKVNFLIKLSELMGWEFRGNGYYSFKGYREWRKEYNKDLESVIFSSGSIFDMSKDQFLNWFDKLPAQARFRVKNRILYSKNADETFKYSTLQSWYKEWETYKLNKQAEQRVLEEKVRQGQASIEDKEKLEKVKKEAKVNVGAVNFEELYKEICMGRVDTLKLEAFMNKVNLPYNSLVIIDDSGSMSGAPFNFASFIAAVCLYKNPDDDARNLLGFFNSNSHWHSYIDRKSSNTNNRLLRNTIANITPEPLIDPTKSFIDNYVRISNYCRSVFQGGATYINRIPMGLAEVCKRNPGVLDALQNYPIWTIISDGEWNSLSSPEASMNDFMRQCETLLGFKPFIVAIDVAKNTWGTWHSAERFSGIDNFMYIPANVAQIEQFLTNFKDMDTFDIYTPLQSIYRSNRYDIIRGLVL